MKQFFLFLAAACLLLIFSPSVKAEESWRITQFKSDLAIQPNGQVSINETIAVDFGSASKHGIFRDIPYIYTNDVNPTYSDITVVSVLQDNQTAKYDTSKTNGYLRIKIGEANKTITGIHTYAISYVAKGVLSSFATYDELYWNVTGNAWPVPIESATATVTLPQSGVVQSSCYWGITGSTASCEQTRQNDRTQTFRAPQRLEANEGLTVAVGYTKGMVPIITVPRPPSPLSLLESPTTWVSFLIVSLAGFALFIRRWWQSGRDDWWPQAGSYDHKTPGSRMPLFAHETLTPEFAPPEKLRPAELGVLVDEKADTLDVSATIVDLAVRGYLHITEEPKKSVFGSFDYLFTRTDKPDKDLLPYEKKLLAALFTSGKETRLSELKYHFHDDLAAVKSALYAQVVAKKLFSANPQTIRNQYYGLAIGIGIVSGLLIWLGFSIWQSALIGTGIALALLGFIGLFFASAMPKRTAYGRATFRKAKGYELFVSGTEKYRQPFFEKENIFMEVLPYAIVFGVTKKLAQAFKEMGITPPQPTWYTGTRPFSAYAFGDSMDSFSRSVSGVMASTPGGSGSGGGGSSGGGFGGGGGGSW